MSTLYYYDICFEYPNGYIFDRPFISTLEEAERIQMEQKLPYQAVRRYRIEPNQIEALLDDDPDLSVDDVDEIINAFIYEFDPDPEAYQGNDVWKPKSS